MRFDARVYLRERADRAGNRAGSDFLARGRQPIAGARELGIRISKFEAESGRLRVNAMRAADRWCELVFEGAALERSKQRVDIRDQDVGGPNQLNVQAGVEHVG